MTFFNDGSTSISVNTRLLKRESEKRVMSVMHRMLPVIAATAGALVLHVTPAQAQSAPPGYYNGPQYQQTYPGPSAITANPESVYFPATAGPSRQPWSGGYYSQKQQVVQEYGSNDVLVAMVAGINVLQKYAEQNRMPVLEKGEYNFIVNNIQQQMQHYLANAINVNPQDDPSAIASSVIEQHMYNMMFAAAGDGRLSSSPDILNQAAQAGQEAMIDYIQNGVIPHAIVSENGERLSNQCSVITKLWDEVGGPNQFQGGYFSHNYNNNPCQ